MLRLQSFFQLTLIVHSDRFVKSTIRVVEPNDDFTFFIILLIRFLCQILSHGKIFIIRGFILHHSIQICQKQFNCSINAELTFHNGIANVFLCNRLSTDGNKVASKKCMTCGQELHNFKKRSKNKEQMGNNY